MSIKFSDKKLQTSLWLRRMAWNIFRYLEPRRHSSPVWRTNDGQTDRMAFSNSAV